jgi:hypothetical protein
MINTRRLEDNDEHDSHGEHLASSKQRPKDDNKHEQNGEHGLQKDMSCNY